MTRLPVRFQRLLRVDENGCWLFTGKWKTGNGYGKARFRRVHMVIHRVIWILLKGPICPGFVLDHGCRVRLCCNPDHLSPVTGQINTRRGKAVLYRRKEEYAAPVSG